MTEATGAPAIDVSAKISEAEAYNSHGLYEEALDLYEEILSEAINLDEPTRMSLLERISQLESLIDDQDRYDDQVLSDQDVSVIKGTWATKGSKEEIIDSAAAFVELGMYKEALAEYIKLFRTQMPVAEIVPFISKCLFELNSPSRVIDKVEDLVAKLNLADADICQIKYLMGQEMESREHKDLAEEFFESVYRINPKYGDIEKKIQDIRGTRTFDSKYGYLLEDGFVETAQLQNALNLSKKSGKSVEFVLMEHFKVSKAEIGKSLSLFYRCKFKNFDPNLPVPHELVKKLKKAFLLQNTWVPLSWGINGVDVLIDNPTDLIKTDQMSSLLSTKKLNFYVGIKEDIEAIIDLFFDAKPEVGEAAREDAGDEDFELLPDIDFEEEEEREQASGEVDESSSQIVKLVDQILVAAYRKNASDIHIEPSGVTKKTTIRYRIDGVCQEVLQLPNANARPLLSRIKIMSNLDISERRLPQDGKIKFKRKGIKPFELRVATLPTQGGYEDAVLRILAESGAMKITEMALTDRNIDVLEHIVKKPYGLFLVVGPTGSGKTTTLHSCLGHINKPGVKIWTAEDPVEITQEGLRQVECKPKIGLDFARVMRAFLRADPDIIMIGEMRDLETAGIGIEASLTGHLVMSTLHTNSAPETVTRLLDMGLNALNFSDALLGVLAQRLVRRLCKNCRKEFAPTRDEFDEIVEMYGRSPFRKTGIRYDSNLRLYRAVGCEDCNGTGYRGRMGIHEMMEGTPELKLLVKKAAPTEELFKLASEQGMTTLIQDGLIKMFQGFTDVNEVRRVCIT